MSEDDIERDDTGQIANPRRTRVSGNRETLRENDSEPYSGAEAEHSDETNASSQHDEL